MSKATSGPHESAPAVSFVEDDYSEIFEEELAYALFDWDDVSSALVQRHDDLLALDSAAVADVELDTLDDDLLRWAVARAALRADQLDTFRRAAAAITETSQDARSRYLDYGAVHLCVARQLFGRGHYEEALASIDAYMAAERSSGGDVPTATRLEFLHHKGLVLLASGQRDEGAALLCEAASASIGTEPELAFVMGEELLDMGEAQAAVEVLQAALTTAELTEDKPLQRELKLRVDMAASAVGDPGE